MKTRMFIETVAAALNLELKTYIYLVKCIYIYIHIYVYMCIYIHTHIYVYIYTYTHTYIYIIDYITYILYTSKPAPSLLSLHFITNSAVSKRQAKQLAIEKLIDLGLEVNIADVILIELSNGMKKRVSLARAMAPLLKTDSVIYNNSVPTSQHTQSESITENQPFNPPPPFRP
jgi:ABC-type dipeptide/oligopeptide/nickel transport system ATPase subunit